jgi:3-dehydroquinate dehydratase-2
MTTLAIVNGPNLGRLGSREPDIYGNQSLEEIGRDLREQAATYGLETEFFHSNHEGAIIDYLEDASSRIQGLIINPGALTHYGYSLRDCLASLGVPIVEVHISNIHTREEWRRKSVISPVVDGVIIGLGPAVYGLALQAVAGLLNR